MDVTPLAPEKLTRRCDRSALAFETTADLRELDEVIGQDRAVSAIRFGMGIRHAGYNLFALGPPGVGKHSVVLDFVRAKAREQPRPDAFCYVNNFGQGHRPKALRLPSGRAVDLARDMAHLVEELRTTIPAAFESEDFRSRRQEIEEELRDHQEQVVTALQGRAEEKGIALIRTPGGLAFAPLRDGEVLAPDEFHKLPKDEQAKISSDVEELQEELRKTLDQMPQWKRTARDRLKELTRAITMGAVGHSIEELLRKWSDLSDVVAYLEAVRADLVDNADQFLESEGRPEKLLAAAMPDADQGLRRYRVNVLVDHDDEVGAPVIYEDHPTYLNLVGRVEHRAQFGALVTDFNLIKPGALHRANGGYLVLDVRRLLQHPYAWEGLKRALRSREIRIESLEQMLSLASTVSLDPEPVALDVKVVLIGDRMLYYLIAQLDPDVDDLFKVVVDFEEDMDRDADAPAMYARLVATIVRREGLLPFHRDAVARVIERSGRMTGDSLKLSTSVRSVGDLLRESDFWAHEAGSDVVRETHVQRALLAQRERAWRIRDRVHEGIERGLQLIDVVGERTGQVNGLAVIALGHHPFGRPTRITARVRMGNGEVVDIERKVELGGALHSKGVLILNGYIAGTYAAEQPLSLWASLVFEQSYGGVDGDSASSAELYALLSALADAPLRQSIAVTGSVDQHGRVQAIGGVNEKIEGFFDVCRSRGLTGHQGVAIPASNVQHLMLADEVIEAVREGRFHVWPIETVTQGIELLTGVKAGERGTDGRFPEGTINARIEEKLRAYVEARKKIAAGGKGGEEAGK
jgi:lon-related putative ATP-dependent protease